MYSMCCESFKSVRSTSRPALRSHGRGVFSQRGVQEKNAPAKAKSLISDQGKKAGRLSFPSALVRGVFTFKPMKM